jgi:hypothetical protein
MGISLEMRVSRLAGPLERASSITHRSNVRPRAFSSGLEEE